MRALALSLTLLFLTACSTTSAVHQAHTRAPGQAYEYAFANQGGDDAEGIAKLDAVIQSHLRDAGLLAPAAAEGRIEVVVKHFYVRSNGARFWAGIMAGRDKIISQVRVLGVDGAQAGDFEVETTNTTAWGTTEGLMKTHAEEIVTRLQ